MDSVTDGSSPGLLLDANVLIDYEGAALDILGLTAKHLGSTAVAAGVFAEVDSLEPEDLVSLGIDILHPTPEQDRRARRLPSGTSFNDRLSFIVCRDGGRVCVTNDLGLRKLCGRHGVPTKYGLELMVDLVAVGALERSRAEEVARMIQAGSPDFYPDRILGRFEAMLDALPLGGRRGSGR